MGMDIGYVRPGCGIHPETEPKPVRSIYGAGETVETIP